MAEKTSNGGSAVQKFVFTANGTFQPATDQNGRFAAVRDKICRDLNPPKPNAATMKEFQRMVWGSGERLAQLNTILTHRGIKENVILTRGVCKEVVYALDWTPYLNEEADLRPHFSYCLDTQGNKGVFEGGSWSLSRYPPSEIKIYQRPHQHEIAKDKYIASMYGDQDKVFYVDDSPEQSDLKGTSVQVVALLHEEKHGITAGNNQAPFERMMKALEDLASEGKQAVVVWDFDCTLSSVHLYKTWMCAKAPTNMQIRRSFSKWDRELQEFLNARTREVIRLEDENKRAEQ